MKSEERVMSGEAGSDFRPIGMAWRVALVIASAALHAFAFPPWNFTPIAFVAIVPFLYAIRDLRPWHAALLGHLGGSAAICGVASWVPSALVFYYQQP
jgi:apolipoprotein N-acyltransferase